LDTLFSFLARKTDFYHGGPKGQAQTILLEKFKKYEQLALEKHKKEVSEREEADRIRKEKLAKKKKEEEESKIVEVNDEEAAKIIAESSAKKSSVEEQAKVAEKENTEKTENVTI
jgi:hypothetical protein